MASASMSTILLKAMGMSSEDILSYYYEKDAFRLDGEKVLRRVEDYGMPTYTPRYQPASGASSRE